jgi:hypothetical protein
VSNWLKKSFSERTSLLLPMVALMWAGNPIRRLLPVQPRATIFWPDVSGKVEIW